MSYKERHEQFVSDLTGGPIWEVYSISALCLLGQALWLNGGSAGPLADIVCNWLIPLATITVYANRPLWLLCFLAIPLGLIFISRNYNKSRRVRSAPGSRNKDRQDDDEVLPLAHRRFVTMYRGSMLIMTATAILAVDFKVFPRRFAKTETWGTSLMDLGVGSFVFSMGVVSSRRSLRAKPAKRRPNFWTELLQSFKHSFQVLLLGIIRLVSVKWLGYQEHVTEYGVHWNFFMTLGLLPPIFVFLKRLPVPFVARDALLFKGYMVALGYELMLKNTGLQEWVLTAKRDSLLAANKEGLASFWGYLAIFMVGYAVGKRILSGTVPLRTVIKFLAALSITAHVLFTVLRVATEPSRSLANFPYVVWVIAYNSAILGCCALVDLWSAPSPVGASLEAVNRNGQKFFLAANVLTGLVNMCIQTIDLTQLPALAVLSAYQGVLFILVQYAHRQS